MPTPKVSETKSARAASAWLILPAVGPALIWLLTAAVSPAAVLLFAVPLAAALLVVIFFLARYALRRRYGAPPHRGRVFLLSICSVVSNVAVARPLARPALELSASKTAWQTKPLDVWAGHNFKATQRTRRVASALTYFSAAGIRSEEEWTTQEGQTTNSRELVDSIGKYLIRTKILTQYVLDFVLAEGRVISSRRVSAFARFRLLPPWARVPAVLWVVVPSVPRAVCGVELTLKVVCVQSCRASS